MTSGPSTRSVFLSYGFRPFFLFAGVYAVLAMLAWMAWLAIHWMNGTVLSPTFAGAPHLWHGHEMIYGYVVAVVTGFLLTAMPNWTGSTPLSGRPLGVLAALWLAGRMAVWFSGLLPPVAVAVVDGAYVPALMVVTVLQLRANPAPRNLIFIGLLALLATGNAAVHAEWLAISDDSASWGLALAIMTVALLITIIGGRVTPAFTRNALIRSGASPDSLPRSHRPLELASVAGAAALVGCYAFAAPAMVTGSAALVAGIANLMRLGLWRSSATLRSPIVWSLHLGYAFLPAGFLAIAAAHLTGGLGLSAAHHVLAVGAAGVMTMAVMSRAALGHTGRPLAVARPIAVAYLLVAAAAILRSFGPEIPGTDYFTVIIGAGTLWVAGFALFAIVYLPVLSGPPLRASAAH